MKEFFSNTGGRFTYKQDYENLQDLALACAELFKECDNFIISGCETSGAVGNTTMTEGYLWINGKVRYFAGQTSINYANTTYLVESDTSENRKFSDDSIKKGVEVYGSVWQETLPVGLEYIEISENLYPSLKEKFFGKYSVLLDTNEPSQALSQLLELKQGLSLLNESYLKTDVDYDTKITWKDSAGDVVGEIGYKAGIVNDLIFDANNVADIEVRPKDNFKSTKPIMEEGVLLENKYGQIGDSYTKSEADALLDDKADVVTTYTKTEVDSIVGLKADKTNVLELDNTTPYTPTLDNHPATKIYVDTQTSQTLIDHDVVMSGLGVIKFFKIGRIVYFTGVISSGTATQTGTVPYAYAPVEKYRTRNILGAYSEEDNNDYEAGLEIDKSVAAASVQIRVHRANSGLNYLISGSYISEA